MQLRTRIAVTLFLLVAAVLAAALTVVSIANRRNATREVNRRLDIGSLVFGQALEENRKQLAQAAQAVAADYAFKEAVAARDTDTLASALENAGARIGASLEVLTSLDGQVEAAAGTNLRPGTAFAVPGLLDPRAPGRAHSAIMVSGARVYQLVAARVRSPLPVAWVVMGFALDGNSLRNLAALTDLGITLSVRHGATWVRPVSTLPRSTRLRSGEYVTRDIPLLTRPEVSVVATLSRSLDAALAPFERLRRVLYAIALTSLLGSAVAAFWLAGDITRPLRRLTAAVARIRGGSYDAPVDVHRHDEIGLLAEGLQVMQSEVLSRDLAIRRLAYEDPLTGLMNRTAFVEALDRAVAAAGVPQIVAVVNLDRFRRINEHLGFATGDAVLLGIASRLRELTAPSTAVARLAADQFAVFRPLQVDETPLAWAGTLASRFAEPAIVDDQPIDVSATIGVAVAPVDAATAEALLRCAELSIEHARRRKQAVAAYSTQLAPAARDQLSLLGELRRAIALDELRLYFQPKWSLTTGRIVGAEVLLRWQHPQRGLLGPGAFLPFAEQTGFIRRITAWTLDRAAAQAAAWQSAGRSLPLAINVTADDIADARFHLQVAEALERHALMPHLLSLEVTESGFIDDPGRAIEMLSALAALGVKLSIDDFGTGYSSLSHLAHMPVDEVKIDRSFVLGLERDEQFAAVIRSAIEMGHRLGLAIVAEGIETDSAAEALAAMGCDVGQGYWLSAPRPLADFEHWLREREAADEANRAAAAGSGRMPRESRA
ncbi:MAG: EAL domain-containing protein [Gammaproteobacteria bacterium]|nr:EAL domain-containing protein [Gammaproteobacteria bacterium]